MSEARPARAFAGENRANGAGKCFARSFPSFGPSGVAATRSHTTRKHVHVHEFELSLAQTIRVPSKLSNDPSAHHAQQQQKGKTNSPAQPHASIVSEPDEPLKFTARQGRRRAAADRQHGQGGFLTQLPPASTSSPSTLVTRKHPSTTSASREANTIAVEPAQLDGATPRIASSARPIRLELEIAAWCLARELG